VPSAAAFRGRKNGALLEVGWDRIPSEGGGTDLRIIEPGRQIEKGGRIP